MITPVRTPGTKEPVPPSYWLDLATGRVAAWTEHDNALTMCAAPGERGGGVARQPLPPVAAVVGFIDCVNRGDVAGLSALMTEDHRLLVLDEPPVTGRDANVAAWQGYMTSFPQYVIYPHQIVEHEGRVAVLGHTTGSHLSLPNDAEARLLVIWVARVRDGALSQWQVLDDGPELRRELGLSDGRTF